MRRLSNPLMVFALISVLATSVLARPALKHKRRPSSECPSFAPVASIEEDYSQTYGTLPDDSLTIRRIDLNNDGTPEWIVAATLSCGAHGCESTIYQQGTQHCFRKIGEMSGSINILTHLTNGYKDLEVSSRSGFDSISSKTLWKYHATLGVYVQVGERGEK